MTNQRLHIAFGINKRSSTSLERPFRFALGQTQFVEAEKGVFIANMIGQHNTIRTDGKPIRYLKTS